MILVIIVWIWLVSTLFSEHHCLCFWVNWETCVSVHSIVVDQMYKVWLSKNFNSRTILSVCSEPNKVDYFFHFMSSSLKEPAIRRPRALV